MKKGAGFLYFARTTDGAAIKVGHSKSPRQRLIALRVFAKRVFQKKVEMIGLKYTDQSEELIARRILESLSGAAIKRTILGTSTTEWYELTPAIEQYLSGLGLIPLDSVFPKKRRARKPKPIPEYKTPTTPAEIISAHMKELGRRGGKQRNENTTPEQRSAIAASGAAKREANKTAKREAL